MESEVSVAVVEDDPTVREAVGEYLRAQGYAVWSFGDGVSARRALREAVPDVVIVDRMLPGISGDELCRELRAASAVPIMMLTALGEVEDRIDGFAFGVDDYLAKPFSMRELSMRVAALVRRARAAQASSGELRSGAFVIDLLRRRAWVRGQEIALTGREYDLLLFLVRNDDRALGREEILREVWGWSVGERSTVTVHVRRLREKIEDDPQDPRHLLTEWGIGYRFRAMEESR
ncbi:response regulator transcription factor [Microbacterium sp. p3-SID338]|uniref:response regulator transcription factor n=1 Tax=unclassified Microbacterium TaxID=2609290 RepID=UPI000C7FF3A7|nr:MULTISPECIES: response regulator transcription factor [unclassified Microbacterium]MCT1396150.1 response regulator transcription factor [Microbacterium sp. p3-SID338]PMC02962.1 DNA-binding response regulator [Microbacterium sp. UMB0228]